MDNTLNITTQSDNASDFLHGFRYSLADNNGALRFFTTPSGGSPTERMRLMGNGNVGIGTTSPGATLEITGDLKIVDGTQGIDKVLTSDANGLASWQTPSGGGDGVPSGVIVMWSGSFASIPAGWALCDGTIGTPDLRDRFVVGAGSTLNVGDTGGEAMHALTVDEMPNHSHDIELGGQQGGGRPFTAGGIAISTGSTEPEGNGQPHENRPPFYALAYIMKL